MSLEIVFAVALVVLGGTVGFVLGSRRVNHLSNQLATSEGTRKAQAERMEALAAEKESVRGKLEAAHEELGRAKTENAQILARQEEREKNFAEQRAGFEEQKKQLKTEFENLSNRIFEARGKDFAERSKASLDEMLNPFKKQIDDFRKRVNDIHTQETAQQASLKAELARLQEMNQQITQDAQNLTTALQGQKKTQGNWGEMILENVLDRSGLLEGKSYRREMSVSTEDGRRRPDVVVFLPGKKHLVIDAKVSLNAYSRYVNSEDESERKLALQEHTQAIKNHIEELAGRDYDKLVGLNSPEVVFMFVPIESAFVEAMKGDESIFQKAIEKRVLVATPTTLLTSLNIVRQLWRFEDQNKNTREIATRAGSIYDKLRTFLESFEGIGKSLESAQQSFRKAKGQLVDGRGSLIKHATEFKKLGVSVKKNLPAEYTDMAESELIRQPELVRQQLPETGHQQSEHDEQEISPQT